VISASVERVAVAVVADGSLDLPMHGYEDVQRDLSTLVVARVGCLRETAQAWEPYVVVDAAGTEVEPVTVFLRDLQAAGRPHATLRSYALDLLRWLRFLWTVEVDWDRATRVEARDFSRWFQLADKPARGSSHAASAGTVNPVTGRPAASGKYAPRTIVHSETVLRQFYDFHRHWGSGPIINPFPLVRRRTETRANAHHNPMRPFHKERAGLYRPPVPHRVPRAIPDERFNELFAALGSHRDRALVAFWVSTGARASELLGTRHADADPGRQLITVIRKGTSAAQRLPASTDAFVWLRLYQQQMHELVRQGGDLPLWWTLRRPVRPLTYHAARAAFTPAQLALGSNWTLHDLRHTAAYRMARDPQVPLTDVQWVLGHSSLTTTQIYVTPFEDDVITGMIAHHARQAEQRATPPAPPAPGYNPGSLDILFGKQSS
jgi:integrase